MKFIILLSICVAVSHQQYREQILMLRPWVSQFYPTAFDDYLPDSRKGFHGDSRVNPIFFRTNEDQMDQKSMSNQYESDGYVQSRNKNIGQQRPALLLPIQDQINKLRFFDGSSRYNFLTRAATFTITSTCTSIAFSSCIPRGNLLPVAPAAVPNCRRKRESGIADDLSQFPIHPTKVGRVLPTVLPSATNEMMADDRESTTIEIVSSKDDTGPPTITSEGAKFNKVKRFFYWPNYITTLTTTSWSVVSTELTRTVVPGVNLNCLPPGYVVCPQAG